MRMPTMPICDCHAIALYHFNRMIIEFI